MTTIIGLNLSHDAGVALVRDGQVAAAMALERTTRLKRGIVPFHLFAHEASNLVDTILASEGLTRGCVDYWIGSSTETADPSGEQALLDVVGGLVPAERRLVLPHPAHHLAHASAAFYCSGMDEATAVVIDSYGSMFQGGRERESSFAMRRGAHPSRSHSNVRSQSRIAGKLVNGEIRVPTDLSGIGETYRVVTLALGFSESEALYDDAGKTMGLASYAAPDMNARWFYDDTVSFTANLAVETLLAQGYARREGSDLVLRPRQGRTYLNSTDEALAAQLQYEFEECALAFISRSISRTGINKLALSGGCFLNSKLNTRIVDELRPEDIFIFPAATDDGNAVGAALYAHHHLVSPDDVVVRPRLLHVQLGPHSREDGTCTLPQGWRPLPEIRHKSPLSAAESAAKRIANGQIVAWYDGNAEFGPRALGGRSILCHPGIAGMKDKLNARVKFREAFRPFAAAVLSEDAAAWFEMPVNESPFMLFVCTAHSSQAANIQEVVHVDGTCRIQTVNRDHPGAIRSLIEKFRDETGIPLVLNTSFNLRGMPIVNSHHDALDCLLGSRLDALYVNGIEYPAVDLTELHPVMIDDARDEGIGYVGDRSVREIAIEQGLPVEEVLDKILDQRRRGYLYWIEYPSGPPKRLVPQYTASKW